MRLALTSLLVGLAVALAGCADGQERPRGDARSQSRPWILVVTLDTTRADAIGPEARGVRTPAFDALAARGRRFVQAYATAPETLPSHSSMFTGLYPAGHAVHENGRFLAAAHPVAPERLRQAGYATSAFVSSFVLSRRFGLARGFDRYDDGLPAGAGERTSAETTDRAIAHLLTAGQQPQLVWVHYFDPHAPYEPAAPFRETYRGNPYGGEVAAMDQQLERLVTAFDEAAGRNGAPVAIIVAGDHGEGLGDHGESQHGNLLYQSTMHVPLVLVGPGVTPGVSATPVSTRRIFHTLMDLAGLDAPHSLRTEMSEVVLGEAMKPFLSYGWQPQVMAIEGPLKAITAGRMEVYDLRSDPAEMKNLGGGASLPAGARKALDEYPVPSPERARASEGLSDEARRSLASLGYVSGGSTPVVRKDAPRPADMTSLFAAIDRASALFVAEQYREVMPLLRDIVQRDPYNLDATLRLATSYSMLGRGEEALAAFRRAAAIAPRSEDVRLYLALHYARGTEWQQAVPTLERVVQESPERVAAVDGLARVRERQGRLREAVELLQKAYALRTPSGQELARLGVIAMSAGQTAPAIDAFERARLVQQSAFNHHLELGVLYLDARRLPEARDALDRVPASHPAYAMALFKRAQVSVLLNEPDQQARIAKARAHGNPVTRELIARERLFQGR